MAQVHLDYIMIKGRRAVEQDYKYNLLPIPVKSELLLIFLSCEFKRNTFISISISEAETGVSP